MSFELKELREIAIFNPSEKIEEGTFAKKIPMANLKEFTRKIDGYELASYKSGPKFRNHDTLVAKITPCLENGKTAYVDILDSDEVAYGSSEFIVLRARDNTDPQFLYYLARSPLFRKKAISCMEGTSGRQRVNENTLKLYEMPIPDKNEQTKIANVLTLLDRKIEINKNIIKKSNVLLNTLYKCWFINFEFPDESGNPFKTAGGAFIYNEELKMHIPENWKTSRLSDLVSSVNNGDWGKEEEIDNYNLKVLCIRGADINGIRGISSHSIPIRYIHQKNTHKILNEYDFVIEISGGSPTQSTGRITGITARTLSRFENPLICSNFNKSLTLKNKKYFYIFYLLWIKLYDQGVFFDWEGKTSGIKNFLFESFTQNYSLPIPDEKIVERFNLIVGPLIDKQQGLLIENDKLSRLRDYLLPLLMNGQISIRDAEDHIAKTFIQDE